MKKAELEKRLRKFKWSFQRAGGKHDIWWNGKGVQEPIPRHNEINENLAKKILEKAKINPGE